MRLNFGPPFDGRAGRFALGFSLLVGVVACVLPLTGTYGPESAILFALTLSPWAGALAARAAGRARDRTTSQLLSEVVGGGVLLLAIPLVALALNAMRANACDPASGLRFIALGPLFGITLASVLGAALGSSLPARAAITLAAVLPVLEIARAAYNFVGSPAIFAYGHFFGYFPGTFYDRQVDVPEAWLTHRALSTLIACAAWALLTALRDPATGKVLAARLGANPVLVLLGAALSLAAATMARHGHGLHHTSSSGSIIAQLGQVVETPHCRVVVPRELRSGDAHRLAEDCELRITQHERLLAVEEDERITAFFFRNAQEKREQMGAARVYIAKPWRREVYLQLAEYPHPVLAHELAHVVARHAATGPFGVPGRLFGLIPEPTLVEGMAVALEPTARDELTPHQWAKAAHAEKLAPKLSKLLGVSFFGTNQALAYTLAGSFLRYVLDTRGAETVRKIYALGSVEAALGRSLDELERDWKSFLSTVPLPERAVALARLRFERASVFSQICPHLVEELEHAMSASLSAGDLPRAAEKCRDVLKIDPNSTSMRATLAGVLARMGDETASARELERLEKPKRAPTPTIARARMAVADAQFSRGQIEEAEAVYRGLLALTQPVAEQRQLDVRLLAAAAGEPARSLLRELLIAEPFRAADPRTAMYLIGELRNVRDDGLAHYLEARQLVAGDRPDLALRVLRTALARGLPSPRIHVEALRMHAQAAYVSGSLAETDAVASELERRDGATLAEQLEARDWRARVAFRNSLR